MKRMRAWFTNYFAFSRTEARGAVLLLLLTITVMGTATVLSNRASEPVSSEADLHTLDSLATILDQVAFARAPKKETKLTLFRFDPNTTDSASFTRLGLRPWIAQRVLRYREKGGIFRRKSDFKKIYGLPEQTYLQLYDYIELPEQYVSDKKPTATPRARRPIRALAGTAARHKTVRVLSVDINVADTSALKKLPGIGSKLSARIVKYRQLLGGYHTIDQLQEIYHMTDAGAASLQQWAYIAEGSYLHKLNINRSDAKTLAQHPYISWALARAMVEHRQDYGEYRVLNDLKEVYLMTEKEFEKIVLYLEI